MTSPSRADKALAPRAELARVVRTVWTVLASWGLAVLILVGLLSAWIWRNQQEQHSENVKVQLERDRAMCALIDPFTSGPEPAAGPDQERSRVVLEALRNYSSLLHCEDFDSQPPVSPRPR